AREKIDVDKPIAKATNKRRAYSAGVFMAGAGYRKGVEKEVAGSGSEASRRALHHDVAWGLSGAGRGKARVYSNFALPRRKRV
ncbi:MAG: hypothetical protein KDA61_02065, partial [Planctomycetales bacterium]|nr:hypothetical protein [Planctomycetales bacterium]